MLLLVTGNLTKEMIAANTKKLKNVKYAPFDPGIFIGGKPMRSILNLDISDDATIYYATTSNFWVDGSLLSSMSTKYRVSSVPVFREIRNS